MLKILLDPVEAPSKVAPGVPEAVDAVVEQALGRIRDERYSTASAFHDALVKAIAPSSVREVAAVVERFCGAVVRRRQEEILRILEGLAPHEPRPKDDFVVVTLTSQDNDAVLTSAATKVAAVMESRAPRRGRSTAWMALVGLVGAAALGFWWARGATPSPPRSTSPAPASSAPAETTASPPPPASAEPAIAVAPSSATLLDASPSPSSSSAARPRRRSPANPASPAPAHDAAPPRSDLHPENPY